VSDAYTSIPDNLYVTSCHIAHAFKHRLIEVAALVNKLVPWCAWL